MNRELIIDNAGDMALLENIPRDVISVVIAEFEGAIRLPRLPAHVKNLSLDRATLNENPRLSEGLESLTLDEVDGNYDLGKWIFPSTLKSFTLVGLDRPVDLRGVTAPTIVFTPVDDAHKVLYPEGLNKLVLWEEVIDFATLPPYLTELRALTSYEFLNEDHVCPTIETLWLGNTEAALRSALPNLRSLLYEGAFADKLPINWPGLREMTFTNCSVFEPVALDTPELETLTIISERPTDRVDLSQNLDLGQSLRTLNLEGINRFPVDTDWERLESVTLVDSPVELPFIQWLDHLETNRPVPTNGTMVTTLSEYKAAWGVRKRAKAAQRL